MKRKKLTIPLKMGNFAERLGRISQLEILAVDGRTWLDHPELDWEQRDPADRTIVALAKRFGCSLVSSDGGMRAYYEETSW